MKRLFFLGLIFTLIFSCSFLCGCGKSPEKKPPQNNEKKESTTKPKEPKELKDIIKDIESILKGTKEKREMKDKLIQSEGQNKEGKGSSQAQSGEGEKKEQNQQKDQEKSSKGEPENWTKEEKTVQSIHEKWNPLETTAVKAGAQDALIREFETNLDDLTNQVMAKSILGTQKAANELYGSAIKIANLFETGNPPQADMMKYFTQKTLLAIEEADWTQAASNAQDLQKQWEKVKTMMDSKSAKLSTQMDYAIHDFEQSIQQRNQDVAKIKGEILLANIEKIIKELEKSKKA